jgi:hypothetical protein
MGLVRAIHGWLEGSMQTSQTFSWVPGRSGRPSTSDFPLRILPSWKGGGSLQTMQELSGATQMTLLIIILSLSASVAPR